MQNCVLALDGVPGDRSAPLGLRGGLRVANVLGTRGRSRRHTPCTASLSAGAASQASLRTLSLALGGTLAKGNLPAALHLAIATPFLHHPASLLTPAAGQAALVTLASLVTVTFSLGGAIYYTARSAWESLEPWLTASAAGPEDEQVTVHGVDVTGSRFFCRPAVKRAVDFAAAAHSGQVRKTRDPYVVHCVETACIVEGLLAPTEDDARAEAAVITALLHDVVDDGGVNPSDIEAAFGTQVESMVRKISQLSATNQLVRRRLRLAEAEPTPQEAAQLRQMILTMVSEPLVIVVKLADRLHNMRTVYALAPEKQRAVADETRRVWCSLAERLGMFALKSELEDLCFAVLQPVQYRALRAELDAMWGVQSIPPAAVVPEDCCLTGECECSYCSDEEQAGSAAASAARAAAVRAAAAVSSRSGGQAEWLGAAHAEVPVGDSPPAAANSSSRGHGGESADDSSAASCRAGNAPFSWLTPQQAEVQELVSSVLPFDASTFNMERLNIPPSARRGLEVLQGCARALLQEITTEGVAAGLEVSVQGRVKSLYSTFKKMVRKGVPLSQVYDARAVRVVVEDGQAAAQQRQAIAACYKLLPAVHRLWRRVQGEDDDYITQPKESGYQSLHTAVIGPGGVPLEVQIRTSSMHEVAEYGRAAHWAYKERPPPPPTDALPAASPAFAAAAHVDAPPALAPGHPVLRISPGGQLCDGVVLRSEAGGMRLLVAVSLAARRFDSPGPTKADPEEYAALHRYVEEQGYFQPGQGDLSASLEMFTLCSDRKFHRLDQFGHKLPTTVVPLQREDPPLRPLASTATSDDTPDQADSPAQSAAEVVAAAAASPEHGSGSLGDSEMAFMQNRIRLLRSMLEWGRVDIGTSMGPMPLNSMVEEEGGAAAEAAAAAAAAASAGLVDLGMEPNIPDVMVLLWPSGKIVRVPRGTTAAALVQREAEVDAHMAAAASVGRPGRGFGSSSGSSGRSGQGGRSRRVEVNVNNRLVGGDTPLQDGDYVVLTKKTVKV